MNRKNLFVAMAFMLAASVSAFAQRSDDEIVVYVKEAAAAGKGQNQIMRELMARGVTREQAERIKKKYENGELNSGDAILQGSAAIAGDGRQRSIVSETGQEVGREDVYTVEDHSGIFGHDIFSNKNLSFEPNENGATPQDYVLGPGDEVIIDVWGNNQDTITQMISPDGRIFVSGVGQIQLGGLSIEAATVKIKHALGRIYSSISEGGSSVSVTLGQIRTIQVNVMGEVNVPGTYRLSSFSTVFNAIYRAGGVTGIGSLRDIKVMRAGKEIASFDIYSYLFSGSLDKNISLQEGDVINVPPYVSLVKVGGGVKRPMTYELNAGETLSDVIGYAGGFSSDSYRDNVLVVRNSGEGRSVSTVKAHAFDGFKMADGDSISVFKVMERLANAVKINGYVHRPGMYELGGEIATVRQLVNHAGGLKEDAFLNRAVIIREKEDLSLETISVDLAGVLGGTAPDVLLKKGDQVEIAGKFEMEDPGLVTINGLVTTPGVYDYAENMTVEDLILLSGGLLDGASIAKVDIARRVNDPSATESADTLGHTFSFAIEDGLVISGGKKFTLEPYDVVSIRRSPAYRPQRFVNVSGEVLFPGRYVLLNEEETLSDVISRAGGVTKRAYVRGASLTRRLSEDERRLNQKVMNSLEQSKSQRDTIATAKLNLDDRYTVAVDVPMALSNPKSTYDISVRENDEIYIPEIDNTVRIAGEVMMPNAVQYLSGKPVSYYINSAGGYNQMAKKRNVFIIYQNGRVSKASGLNARVEPGCMVIVPSKQARKQMSVAEVMAIAQSATSLASLTGVLMNLFK